MDFTGNSRKTWKIGEEKRPIFSSADHSVIDLLRREKRKFRDPVPIER